MSDQNLQIPQLQNISYDTTSVILEGLEEFTNYSIEVAAVTIGVDVYSDAVFTVTERIFGGKGTI